MNILQVSTGDVLGGAERVALNLHEAYRRTGHQAYLAVGRKKSADPAVLQIRNDRIGNPLRRAAWSAHYGIARLHGRLSGARQFSQLFRQLAEPASLIDAQRGHEDFNFPGTWRLLDQCPEPVDVVHCHNLHGRYFDLRALPWLSRQVPTIITMHDAWLLAGHCAHSFDCDRWKSGCGQCPDLSIYPSISHDGTAFNLRRKVNIFADSKLHIAVPCRWLYDRVTQSALAPHVADLRIIPNGVDLNVFRPADRHGTRQALDLPPDAIVLLFSALGVKSNIWKDFQTMRDAAVKVASQCPGQRLIFVALGEPGSPEQLPNAEIRFLPFEKDVRKVAHYYQAADIYVHASRADTFPNTILEAQACGTPVVATAVGGISEQIRSLSTIDGSSGDNFATGIVVSPADSSAMAEAIRKLLEHPALHDRMSAAATQFAREKFDLNLQVKNYVEWYEELMKSGRLHPIHRASALAYQS